MADLKNDIEKYLRGELSPEDRHALEKRALSDPFLADALEGGESLPIENFTHDLGILETALNARVQKRGKVIPLWLWPARIAAGLLLLAVSTFVIINLIRQDPSPGNLAQSKNEKTTTTPPEKPALARDSVNPDATKNNAPKQEQAKEEEKSSDGFLSLTETERTDQAVPPAKKSADKDVASGPAQWAQPQQEPVTTATSEAAQDDVLKPETKKAEEQVSQSAAPVAAAGEGARDNARKLDEKETAEKLVEISPSAGFSKQKSKRTSDDTRGLFSKPSQTLTDSSVTYRARGNSGRVVRGQVTSADDGKGLPGVNVIIKGTNEGTVTNAEGYYQIAVKDETDLLFSFIGMENQEVTPGATSEVNVALNADMTQLSEVVVVGYGADKKAEDVSETYEFAAPNGGRTAFKQYLETNLRYPEQALESDVEGRVTIQFTVETTGELSNFKVLKGIGSGCDEEVIRLIQRGPKWDPTKRDEVAIRDKVKVRVRFRMPKR